MSYIINGESVQESVFWHNLHGLASERQLYMILEGLRLNIGGNTFYIEGIRK